MTITENDIFFDDSIPAVIQDVYMEILEAWCYTHLKKEDVYQIFIKDYNFFPGTIIFETFFNKNHKIPDKSCDMFIKLPLLIKVTE